MRKNEIYIPYIVFSEEKSQGLRQSYLKCQHKNNRRFYLKRMSRVDGGGASDYSLQANAEVPRYPLVISHNLTVKNIQNYSVFLRKHFYTIEPHPEIYDFSNNALKDVIAHLNWTKMIYKDYSKRSTFLQAANETIKRDSFDNKIICNSSLVNECNYFLDSNQFEMYESKYTGHDEYGLFYHLKKIGDPIKITTELFTSFMADKSTVRIVFSDQPPENTLIQFHNKDTYVTVYAKLVTEHTCKESVVKVDEVIPTAAIK